MLLTALTGWPGIGPGFEVRGAPGDRSADNTASPGASTSGDARRGDLRDTVEISQQAEAQLVGQLSEDARRNVQELQTRDREVRAHEQAHLAAAGPFAQGGASFEYATGPDGRQYAVGGEVSIDSSPVQGDPEATIQKAQVIRAAAMAPADPSAQDRRVAAAATKMEAQARQELRKKQQTEAEETSAEVDGSAAAASGAAEASRDNGFEEFVGMLFDAVA